MGFFNNLVFSLRTYFSGALVFNKETRNKFREEILSLTVSRTKLILIVVFLIQISNLITDISTQNTPGYIWQGYELTYFIGIYLLIFVAIIFSIIIKISEHYKHKLKYLTRNIIIKSTWIFLLGGTLFFCFSDIAYKNVLSNFTLIILITGVMPIFNPVELFSIVGSYSMICLTWAFICKMDSSFIQQIIVLVIIALFTSNSQYKNSINIFKEREALREANQKLYYLSETDQLTGLLNRRGLNTNIYNLIQNVKTEEDIISVIMVDIDFFKKYNDKFLHSGGDRCLNIIGESIKNCINTKDYDIAARYGGEEFIVIAKGLNSEKTLKLAIKIKDTIAKLQIPFDLNDGFPFVTISEGTYISKLDYEKDDLERFIKNIIDEADKQLYNAKENGRNCISYQNVLYR